MPLAKQLKDLPSDLKIYLDCILINKTFNVGLCFLIKKKYKNNEIIEREREVYT